MLSIRCRHTAKYSKPVPELYIIFYQFYEPNKSDNLVSK